MYGKGAGSNDIYTGGAGEREACNAGRLCNISLIRLNTRAFCRDIDALVPSAPCSLFLMRWFVINLLLPTTLRTLPHMGSHPSDPAQKRETGDDH